MTPLISFSLSYEFVNKQLLLLLLLLLLLHRLVSKEIAVWRRWESETPKFGIKRVDEVQISTVEIKKLTFRVLALCLSEYSN